MSTSESPPAGPDFVTSGVALADLADGAMVLGHASGDAVLMARRGDEVFAVGATCTHWAGPLAEGLIVGDTVRCPWHHACFSLRNGEALRAPALSPVPWWTVERRSGRAYVTAKHEHDPLVPVAADTSGGTRSSSPSAVVIIGGGAAGSAAAEMLERQGFVGRLTIVDSLPDEPVDRPNLSKDYLSGVAPEEFVSLRPPDFYAVHGIEVVRSTATSIDTAARRVELADGSSHPYDALLLALGAEPRRLDVKGHDLKHVYTLRSLSDSRAIIARAKTSHRAVVLGSSFIGLEVAASLRARNLDVHVVAPEQRPLEKILGPGLGAMVQTLHEEHGVIFHLEQTAASIEDDVVVLQNGVRLPADFVVVGIGVIPRLDLARAAGVLLDRGVTVNEYMETNVPGIYAAGDIARWPDPHTGERIRVEHWVVAQRQGQTAARNILGAREPFDMVPFFWSQHYDLAVSYTGLAEKWDTIDVSGEISQRECAVAYRQGGKTLAVATVSRDLECLRAEVALEREDEAELRRIVPA